MLVPLAHAEQQAGAFAMEVERRVEVDDHDVRRGHAAGRLRAGAAMKMWRRIGSTGTSAPAILPIEPRVRAGGVHDDPRLDRAARRLDRGDATAGDA